MSDKINIFCLTPYYKRVYRVLFWENNGKECLGNFVYFSQIFFYPNTI